MHADLHRMTGNRKIGRQHAWIPCLAVSAECRCRQNSHLLWLPLAVGAQQGRQLLQGISDRLRLSFHLPPCMPHQHLCPSVVYTFDVSGKTVLAHCGCMVAGKDTIAQQQSPSANFPREPSGCWKALNMECNTSSNTVTSKSPPRKSGVQIRL